MKLFGRSCVMVSMMLAVASCGSEVPLPTVAVPEVEASFIETSTSPVPLTPLVELDIPTYERSGQAVHPDVVHFATGWHGWEYWMAMTPFPGGHEAFENPSILVSHDGLQWQLPAALRNPLARTPGKLGYNSDADISYDASGDRLVMIYREVTATQNVIHSMTSLDGIHWTRSVRLFQRPNHNMVSPTLTFGASGTPQLWYVDAGPKNCGERVTHVAMQTAAGAAALTPAAAEQGWSAPRRNVLVQPGINIWHLDVTWIPERNEYWAVYIGYPIHHCAGEDLYFARSSDGVRWTTYAIPFMRHEEAAWTASTLYRASVLYDASRNAIQFFISGSNKNIWGLGYVDYALPSFLSSLEHGSPVLVPATSRVSEQGPFSEP